MCCPVDQSAHDTAAEHCVYALQGGLASLQSHLAALQAMSGGKPAAGKGAAAARIAPTGNARAGRGAGKGTAALLPDPTAHEDAAIAQARAVMTSRPAAAEAEKLLKEALAKGEGRAVGGAGRARTATASDGGAEGSSLASGAQRVAGYVAWAASVVGCTQLAEHAATKAAASLVSDCCSTTGTITLVPCHGDVAACAMFQHLSSMTWGSTGPVADDVITSEAAVTALRVCMQKPCPRAWAELARSNVAASKLPAPAAGAAGAAGAAARTAVLEAIEDVLPVLVAAGDLEGVHAACKLTWNTGGLW
jgi:hypothetical protein